jgi:RND family efflux transporter MFP subunit
MSRRSVFLRVVILLVLAAGGVWGLWRFAGPRTVTVAHPMRGTAVQAVYATGTVESSVTVRIAPQLGGRITELKADEGQAVKAGDVLARLDDRDMRASAGELRARAVYAQQQHERAEALVNQGWATRDRLDQARAERDAAQQAVKRIEDQLTFMTLTSAADGTIIRRDGEAGEYVPVNQPVFYLAKAGAPLRVTADVDEEDVPLVKAGQKVLIKADAFPREVFKGQVTEVTPKGDPVARSYRVRVTLPADTALQIGMTAETNIITVEHEKALMVPATALVGSMVWLEKDGRIGPGKLHIGVRGRDRVEILAGLGESSRVVLNPPPGMRDGDMVRAQLIELPAPGPSGPSQAAVR